jgi:hypothetical protein
MYISFRGRQGFRNKTGKAGRDKFCSEKKRPPDGLSPAVPPCSTDRRLGKKKEKRGN